MRKRRRRVWGGGAERRAGVGRERSGKGVLGGERVTWRARRAGGNLALGGHGRGEGGARRSRVQGEGGRRRRKGRDETRREVELRLHQL